MATASISGSRSETLLLRRLAAAALSGACLLAACGGDGDGTGTTSAGGGTGGDVTGGSAGADAASGGDGAIDAPMDAPSCPGAPVEHTFTALGATEDVLNPGRGFHDGIDLTSTSDYSAVRAAGRTLAYAGVSLLDYLDAPIAASFLSQIDSGLDRVRKARIKVVLRFVYRNAATSPNDAPLARIQEHIAQLAPLLQKHADVIAVLEAGFIGPWGEWHSSTNGLDTDPAARKAVLDALLAAAPASVSVLVRKWSFKKDFAGGPVTEAQAFGGAPVARVGHHNDCFLSSDTDVGTYPSDQIDAWKDLIALDTRFVPIGGETCADYEPRTQCSVAVPEMEKLHFTFLNALYHPGALGRFASEGCYDEIAARLGYRLVIERASFSGQAKPGCALALDLTLRNDGFAPPYAAEELYLVLDGPTRFEAKLPVDPRRFEPGKHELAAVVPLPATLPPGAYRVALFMPDRTAALRDVPEYAIRFANASLWDATSGLNVLYDALQVSP